MQRWILNASGCNGNNPAIGEFRGDADELKAWFIGLCGQHDLLPETVHTQAIGDQPERIEFRHKYFYKRHELAFFLCDLGDVRGDLPYGYWFDLVDEKPGYQKIGMYFD